MSQITVIGEMNVRVIASGYRELLPLNPTNSRIEASYAGTAEAIAKRAIEAGENVTLMTALGNDFLGRAAKNDMVAKGINVDNVMLVEDMPTPIEIITLNILGDLDYNLVNEETQKSIKVEHIEAALDMINASDLVAVDASLSQDVLEYIADNVTAVKFFDPGTEEYAKKAKGIIGKFDIIKPNRAEASALYGKDIFSEDELRAACEWLQEQGVKKIFITLSGGGVFYKDGGKDGFVRPEEVFNFVRKDGAGDAFSAAIADGYVKGMSVEEIAAYGMKEAEVIMRTKHVFDPNELLWGESVDGPEAHYNNGW